MFSNRKNTLNKMYFTRRTDLATQCGVKTASNVVFCYRKDGYLTVFQFDLHLRWVAKGSLMQQF